ncbi:MAG: hypothetical protein Q7U82_14165 [Gammaproteobacteria bacterium]|nr:hypothetical protein [Gammaproteobacteria bacterium]
MKQNLPIWERVHQCAQELTKNGNAPFTRGDIIKCVQRYIPNCNPDSINPIIQGITDNLRGGAPGAAGKNLLHSVGRGLFILKTSSSIGMVTGVSRSKPSGSKTPLKTTPVSGSVSCTPEESDLAIGAYAFKLVCQLDLQTTDDGKILEYKPQLNYVNSESLSLNKYGNVTFCKFKIPSNLQKAGVYIIGMESKPQYVGECINLSTRFNTGYGNISPRNCYVGGQETNCRINNLVLENIKSGIRLFLWFHETPDYKSVELTLRKAISFPWNRA